MGTRGMVHVKDSGKTITSIYHHYDGYPSGLGNQLLKHLYQGNVILVNGLGVQKADDPYQFNGMGDLAAYLVSQLKGTQSGNVYLEKPSSRKEQYTYTLYNQGNKVHLKLFCRWGKKKNIYNGPLKDFDPNKISTDEE